MNLVNLLEERAVEYPHRPALVEGVGRRRRSVSFADLSARVRAGSTAMRACGIEAGDVILFLHPVSIKLYVALLSAMRIGAVPLLVDPGAGLAGVRAAVQRVPPRAWTGHGKGRLAAWLLLSLWGTRRLPSGTRRGTVPSTSGAEPVNDDAPALITFTSGSTGQPKAAVRSHGFLLAQNRVLGRSIELEPGEVDLVTLPVFALANLAHGVTSVLAGRNGEEVAEQVRQESVERCAAAPAFFERCLDSGVGLGKMRKIFTGGGPVFPPLLECLRVAAPGARVAAVYGSTEAEPIAHVEAEAFTDEVRERMQNGAGLLAGRPVEEIRLAIFPDCRGKPIAPMGEREFSERCRAPGEPGEIVVSGAHVLEGYLDGVGDEETKFRVGGTTWHRTGDAGRLDEQGRLWLLGRCGEVIRDGRGIVYPFSIETSLSFSRPEGRHAVLAHRGERLLVTDSNLPISDDQVRSFGIDRLVRIPRIPLDRRHRTKIDYPLLRRLLESSSSS